MLYNKAYLYGLIWAYALHHPPFEFAAWSLTEWT